MISFTCTFPLQKSCNCFSFQICFKFSIMYCSFGDIRLESKSVLNFWDTRYIYDHFDTKSEAFHVIHTEINEFVFSRSFGDLYSFVFASLLGPLMECMIMFIFCGRKVDFFDRYQNIKGPAVFTG